MIYEIASSPIRGASVERLTDLWTPAHPKGARIGVSEDAPVWAGCGRGLSRGAHSHELIGRNEPGLQHFHEVIAEKTGYTGLRYVKPRVTV